MSVVLVTGSGGLIGAEAVRYFSAQGHTVAGIDNDMRRTFFGDEASTAWAIAQLRESCPRYEHHAVDIREYDALDAVFRKYAGEIVLVIHTAAQPSHDWAAKAPRIDFAVNATGTLHTLECARAHCPEAVFIFTSTNKVYGDRPNTLPLIEQETRWEIAPDHPYADGITEDMPIDQCLHSVFGAAKVAADVMVQEYGRYFGMKTVCFRGGCLTGPGHAGAELHGFLAYLMKCCALGRPYTIYGYQGKQVRDNIHSHDLVRAFDAVFCDPRPGAVYNIGGGRLSNCSMQEAIALSEEICGRKMQTAYVPENRVGDHIWWIGSLAKFQAHYPDWTITYDIPRILEEVCAATMARAGDG